MANEGDCRYRRPLRGDGRGEDAVCGLLVELSGVRDETACRVRRDACVACCASAQPSPSRLNPVVASLLYRLSANIVERGGVPGCSDSAAAQLRNLAEPLLAPNRVEPATHRACDVIVCLADSSALSERAIRSALEQDGAIPIVHLIDDGGGGSDLLNRYAGRWNVLLHRNPVPRGPFATLHDLLPHLRSEFVALQDPATISRRGRFAAAVDLLQARGGEILAAPLESPAGTIPPTMPRDDFVRRVPAATLAFRRSSLIDLGGFADRPGDADAELLHRADRERRTIVFATEPAAELVAPDNAGAIGPTPQYQDREGSLRHHGRGFPMEHVECDVVLPFHGHIEYLRDSLPSVLEQDGAEAVVHLIDDGTPGGAEETLRYWGTHPRVRTYRNARNLGQFASFNNVVPFFETKLAAVQDADDVSRPHRLRWSGNLLRLADAEVFGGRTRPFRERPGQGQPQADGYNLSRVPRTGVGFFLQNPTAMVRVATFEALRGFGDYGDLDCNKCGLDTEFYARAFYAGARFAISRTVVVDYRLHPDSAVHNDRTGWGSSARLRSETENFRRFYLFQQGPFDPRVFGALDAARGLTERFGSH